MHLSLGSDVVDRFGNRAVGGKHIRTVAANPGGTVHTTDKTVADALVDEWGIDPRINIVGFPSSQGIVNPSVIRSVEIIRTLTLDLFDRIQDPQG